MKRLFVVRSVCLRSVILRSVILGAVGVAVMSSNGCALIPLAALGAAGDVADIGSAAFSAGTEVFAGGRLESVEFCTFTHAQAAVRSTLNDLRLHLTESTFDKVDAKYHFRDDAGGKIDIELKRRTPAICSLRISVGYFGSEAYARLLLKSVRARLPSVSARPATQPAEPVDLLLPRHYGDFGTRQADAKTD